MKFNRNTHITIKAILFLILVIFTLCSEVKRLKRVNRSKSNSKVHSKFLNKMKLKTLSKFVSRKAGTLTLEALVNAADKEYGFNDKLRNELLESPVQDDLRITRIRLLENKEEYGIKIPIDAKGTTKRFPHQSMAICIKTYSKAKFETQDDIDNKKTAYFFLFERMIQEGLPDIRFQYLGYDIDCRDGVFSTASNWKVAEMFTQNADMEAALKVTEQMEEDAAKHLHEAKKKLEEFFKKKAKEQAAWLVGHATLGAIHATGIGIVVSGPIHLIYGAAHAIHTAVSTKDDIEDLLSISKEVALYIKNVMDNPFQKKLENDKVKDNPKNNRSVKRFLDAINRYETDERNTWSLDVSDSRTFATGFYNAIKKGHESNEYVKFQYFLRPTEKNESLHAKSYFYSAAPSVTEHFSDIDYK